jgi:hypothetical protein
MYVLNSWYTVPDYEAWKKVFDSDPLGREASGVRSYRIERLVGDEQTVIGHLEFDSLDEAQSFAGRLQAVWNSLGGEVMSDPGFTITEVLEQRSFVGESGRRAA